MSKNNPQFQDKNYFKVLERQNENNPQFQDANYLEVVEIIIYI